MNAASSLGSSGGSRRSSAPLPVTCVTAFRVVVMNACSVAILTANDSSPFRPTTRPHHHHPTTSSASVAPGVFVLHTPKGESLRTYLERVARVAAPDAGGRCTVCGEVALVSGCDVDHAQSSGRGDAVVGGGGADGGIAAVEVVADWLEEELTEANRMTSAATLFVVMRCGCFAIADVMLREAHSARHHSAEVITCQWFAAPPPTTGLPAAPIPIPPPTSSTPTSSPPSAAVGGAASASAGGAGQHSWAERGGLNDQRGNATLALHTSVCAVDSQNTTARGGAELGHTSPNPKASMRVLLLRAAYVLHPRRMHFAELHLCVEVGRDKMTTLSDHHQSSASSRADPSRVATMGLSQCTLKRCGQLDIQVQADGFNTFGYSGLILQLRWLRSCWSFDQRHPLLAMLHQHSTVPGDPSVTHFRIAAIEEHSRQAAIPLSSMPTAQGTTGTEVEYVRGVVVDGPWAVQCLTLSDPSFLFLADVEPLYRCQQYANSSTLASPHSTAATSFKAQCRLTLERSEAADYCLAGWCGRPAEVPYLPSSILRSAVACTSTRSTPSTSPSTTESAPSLLGKLIGQGDEGNRREQYAFYLYSSTGLQARYPLGSFVDSCAVLPSAPLLSQLLGGSWSGRAEETKEQGKRGSATNASRGFSSSLSAPVELGRFAVLVYSETGSSASAAVAKEGEEEQLEGADKHETSSVSDFISLSRRSVCQKSVLILRVLACVSGKSNPASGGQLYCEVHATQRVRVADWWPPTRRLLSRECPDATKSAFSNTGLNPILLDTLAILGGSSSHLVLHTMVAQPTETDSDSNFHSTLRQRWSLFFQCWSASLPEELCEGSGKDASGIAMASIADDNQKMPTSPADDWIPLTPSASTSTNNNKNNNHTAKRSHYLPLLGQCRAIGLPDRILAHDTRAAVLPYLATLGLSAPPHPGELDWSVLAWCSVQDVTMMEGIGRRRPAAVALLRGGWFVTFDWEEDKAESETKDKSVGPPPPTRTASVLHLCRVLCPAEETRGEAQSTRNNNIKGNTAILRDGEINPSAAILAHPAESNANANAKAASRWTAVEMILSSAPNTVCMAVVPFIPATEAAVSRASSLFVIIVAKGVAALVDAFSGVIHHVLTPTIPATSRALRPSLAWTPLALLPVASAGYSHFYLLHGVTAGSAGPQESGAFSEEGHDDDEPAETRAAVCFDDFLLLLRCSSIPFEIPSPLRQAAETCSGLHPALMPLNRMDVMDQLVTAGGPRTLAKVTNAFGAAESWLRSFVCLSGAVTLKKALDRRREMRDETHDPFLRMNSTGDNGSQVTSAVSAATLAADEQCVPVLCTIPSSTNSLGGGGDGGRIISDGALWHRPCGEVALTTIVLKVPSLSLHRVPPAERQQPVCVEDEVVGRFAAPTPPLLLKLDEQSAYSSTRSQPPPSSSSSAQQQQQQQDRLRLFARWADVFGQVWDPRPILSSSKGQDGGEDEPATGGAPTFVVDVVYWSPSFVRGGAPAPAASASREQDQQEHHHHRTGDPADGAVVVDTVSVITLSKRRRGGVTADSFSALAEDINAAGRSFLWVGAWTSPVVEVEEEASITDPTAHNAATSTAGLQVFLIPLMKRDEASESVSSIVIRHLCLPDSVVAPRQEREAGQDEVRGVYYVDAVLSQQLRHGGTSVAPATRQGLARLTVNLKEVNKCIQRYHQRESQLAAGGGRKHPPSASFSLLHVLPEEECRKCYLLD